jgi:hypothetical protein
MARWKAWLCRLGMPGRTGPRSGWAAPDDELEGAFGRTAASAPSSPTSKITSRAQPSGSSA